MNAQILQLISIITFALAGLCTVLAVVLFFWLDIRTIWNELSGKTEERQIKEFREQNRRRTTQKNGSALYAREQSRAASRTMELAAQKQETVPAGPGASGMETAVLPGNNEGTVMLEEDEGTVMLRDDESTTILEADSMATTLLGDSEATTVLGAGEAARGGPYSERPLKGEFYPVLNCIVIHTEERI